MGRRCSKKAVRCGAIGVFAWTGTGGNFSSASSDVDLRRDFSTVPRQPPGRVLCCFGRVCPLFSFMVIPALPWQIVRHGRQCPDRKSTRLNSSHGYISYAVFCLKKKTSYISNAAFLGTINPDTNNIPKHLFQVYANIYTTNFQAPSMPHLTDASTYELNRDDARD